MYKLILLLLPFFILSCQKTVDFEVEKKNIQAQIDLVKEAHLSKDAAQFFQPNADSFYDIRYGNFEKVNKVDLIPGTQSYLDNMEFMELKKSREPIIEISKDGTMASYIGASIVKGRLNNQPMFWVVSWQSVFKKIDKEWKIISTANTEANKEAEARVLLDQIRTKLGSLENKTSIYANAECIAPEAAFKTLILSRKTDGKMEQIYGNSHILMKHGKDSFWGYNLKTKSPMKDVNESTKAFIQGHELHWLSFYPEDRYSDPFLKDIVEFQNETAFNIQFKDSFGQSINFYYSFETYSPLGFIMDTDGQGPPVSVSFENWDIKDDVRVFKKAILKHGDEIFEYNFIDIKFNQLDTEDFESKIALIK